MYFIQSLRQLCKNYESSRKVTDLWKNHDIIVSTDGAIGCMRELTFIKHDSITFDDREDVMFMLNKIPVHLRHDAPPGHAIIVAREEVPPRGCCDIAVYQTVMIAAHRGTA